MSLTTSKAIPSYLDENNIADIDNRQRHAEAQARYRARNLAKTLEDARLRRKKERTDCSPGAKEAAAEKRRAWDADYRERQRQKKFKAKFGEQAWCRDYLPLYKLEGKNHLPGIKFDFEDPVKEAAWRAKKRAQKKKATKRDKQP